VPDRDDVRFDVAFGPADAAPPLRGASATSAREGARMEDGRGGIVLRDVAPVEGTYEVTLPLQRSQERLRIDLQPKRFCFEEPDRRPFAYAPPHRVDVDIAAECGRL
jgi:hypothetical protein